MLPVIKISKKLDSSELKKFFLSQTSENKEILGVVNKIIGDVRENGDKALVKYTKKFDSADISVSKLRVTGREFEEAYEDVNSSFIKALRRAKKRVYTYHRKEKLTSFRLKEKDGTLLGQLTRPLSRVGVYVPGGKVAYPSSVLMNVIPAKVAGVKEVAICTPPSDSGSVNPATLVAASEVGIKEVYKVGGAQAIAAFAYGTKSIKKVDKIAGPGNIYVTAAKRLVFPNVGVDMLAGPSEVVILADNSANPSFAASDMLAQAEHDIEAVSILITTSQALANKVRDALKEQLVGLKRKKTIRIGLKKNGKIFLVATLNTALRLIDIIAPEHLELMVKNPHEVVKKVNNAAAIFLGSYTPVAMGDYIAGPSHVLPTAGTARFSSPLGVVDFLKRSSLVFYTKAGLKKASLDVARLAEVEGLEAHARSVTIRLSKKN